MHRVAVAGFESDADRYDRARPGYPPEVVQLLADRLSIGPRATVLDLAAGTGKFTRLLTGLGARVIAAEPVPAMHAVLRRRLPEVPVLGAVAEHLPMADASLDAVTAAQAFHWFDPEPTWTELARVVRPGGGVGLVWNARLRQAAEWIDRVWSVMDRVEKHAPWRDHDRRPRQNLEANDRFGPLEEAVFHHEVETDVAGIVERILSVSHVAVLPAAERARVASEIERIATDALADLGRLVIPYRVDVFWRIRC